jgi:hypothetical protein
MTYKESEEQERTTQPGTPGKKADLLHTFARFLRHSVQALGVTTPSPRRRFEFCVWVTLAVAGPDAVEGVLEE